MAAIVTVSAFAGEAASHSSAQCPFAEIFVRSIRRCESLRRNCAPARSSPSTSSIAFGILAHQFGGSTFLMTGCCARAAAVKLRRSAMVEQVHLEELTFIFILIEKL